MAFTPDGALYCAAEFSSQTPAESYGADPSATAAVNTTAIQAALDQTGFVTLTTPGTYLISDSSLVISSNTTFWIGAGVVIKQSNTAGQARQVLVNYAYTTYSAWNSGSAKSGPLTISVGNITSSGKTVTVVFDQDHGLAVGDWVSIWNVSTAGYCGVHQVVSAADTTTITYTAMSTPAASPGVVSTHAGYTMAGMKCDVNIAVMGGGTLDFDVDNNASAPASSARTCCTTFANIYGLYLNNFTARQAIKYNFYLSGVRSARCRDLRADGPSDGWHASGNIFDTVLSGASGLTLDNFVAFGTADFTTYQLCMGPVKGLVIENIGLEENKGVRCFGESDNTIEDVVIRTVYGTTSGNLPAIQLYNDSGVQGGGTVYKGIVLEDIAVDVGTGSMISAQGATGSSLTVRDCRSINSTSSGLVTANNGSGTSRHARIHIEDCALTAAANAIAMLNVNNATCTVDDAVIIGCTITSSSVSYGRMIDNTTGVLTAAVIMGSTMNGGNALYVASTGATPPAVLRLVGNYLASPIYGVSWAKAATIKIIATGNVVTTASGGNGMYRDASTGGKLKIVSAGNAYVSGTLFARSASQTCEVYGWDLQLDPLTLCDAVIGSYCYSTNSGATDTGPCVYASSSASWVALGTGAAGINTVIA